MSWVVSPRLASIPAMSFGQGSSLTVFCPWYSLYLHCEYNSFRKVLKEALQPSDGSNTSTVPTIAIETALKVLQKEGEGDAEMDGGTGATTTD